LKCPFPCIVRHRRMARLGSR